MPTLPSASDTWSAGWEYATSPVKQVTSTWDCLWSPIQCVKAAFGDEETSAKAYREMRQPGSTQPQPQQQVTVLPRSVQPITDSQVPFAPGCAPGWIYHEGLGTCMKELVKQTPAPQLYVTPGADGQPTVVQTTMSQPTNKAVLILAMVLVGAAVFSLFRSR